MGIGVTKISYTLKLVKEAIRTKLEILLQGPTNIYIQQLQNIVNELVQKIESRNSPYFETELLLLTLFIVESGTLPYMPTDFSE